MIGAIKMDTHVILFFTVIPNTGKNIATLRIILINMVDYHEMRAVLVVVDLGH